MEADPLVRQLIVDATRLADQQLAVNPYDHSESRPGGRRIEFVFPIGIQFFIEQDDTVAVEHVWVMGGRRRRA